MEYTPLKIKYEFDFCEKHMPQELVDYADSRTRVDIMFFNIEGKEYNCYCSKCGESSTVKKSRYATVRHNDYCKCKDCGAELKYFNVKFDTSKFSRDTRVSFAQKLNGGAGIVFRIFDVWVGRKVNYKQNITLESFHEEQRIVFLKNKVIRLDYCSHWFARDGGWKQMADNTIFRKYGKVGLSVDECIKGTCLDKLHLDLFYSSYESDRLAYLRGLIIHPQIEYLLKLGYKNLASQMCYKRYGEKGINIYGKNYEEVMGVPKNVMKFINKKSIYDCELWAIRKMYEYKMPLQEIKKHSDKPHSVRSAIDCYKIVEDKVSFNKFLKWCLRETVVAGYYNDYIGQCDVMGLDKNNEKVLMPKDFHEVHDRLSIRIKYAVEKDAEALYYNIQKQWNFLQVVSNDYAIILPKSLKEIIYEGEFIGHCVGGYTDRVTKGNSLILFARHTNNLAEPLSTIEIKPQTQTVTQYSGNGKGTKNESVDPALKNFIKTWATKNNLKISA